MIESFLKLSEYSGTLNQVSLHFWSHLLVELEFFNNQVEIEVKGLLNILSDIIVQSWLNMEWFVRLLDLFDPHVQRIKFFFNQIFEVIWGTEDTIDRSHEEGEECQTEELQDNWENVLVRGCTSIITISYCRNNFKNPVESKNIDWEFLVWSIIKIVGINPRLSTSWIRT